MAKEILFKITATEANWNNGEAVDVDEAMGDLQLSVGELLEKIFDHDEDTLTLTTEDQIWNEGTDDEAVVEPHDYTFKFEEVKND